MMAHILRRLLMLPVVLFGVSILLFLILQLLSPEQRAVSFVTSERQMNQLDAIIDRYGLDEPIWVQYGNWLGQILQGNLGWSQSVRMPVSQAISLYLPATAELALAAFFPIVLIGIWLGVLAATHRDKLLDQITRVLAIVGWSLPSFVVALWLLQIFYGGLGWLEPGRISLASELAISLPDFKSYTHLLLLDSLLNGRPDVFWDVARHLILPVVTLTIISSAQLVRVMRSSMLEALGQDYVRTARAKGLVNRRVVYKHALRNAMIPVLTLAGLVLFGLLGGVVITETVFNYPGLGNWSAKAAVQLDIPAVLGYAMFSALVVSVANLVVDVTYGLVDPRIRYQ
jgi:peptide/nickel transport system permease protein